MKAVYSLTFNPHLYASLSTFNPHLVCYHSLRSILICIVHSLRSILICIASLLWMFNPCLNCAILYASGAYRLVAPAYLSDIVTATADSALPRKTQIHYEHFPIWTSNSEAHCFGERGFSYAGPKAWNDLLGPALQELTDTLCTFKRLLSQLICSTPGIYITLWPPLVL